MEKLFKHINGVMVEFTEEDYLQREIDIINDSKLQSRIIRNNLLSETDYLMLPDNPKIDTAEKLKELKAYRQALRDLPKQIVDSKSELVIPTKPNWL